MRGPLFAEPLSAVVRPVAPGAGIVFTGQPWKIGGARPLTGLGEVLCPVRGVRAVASGWWLRLAARPATRLR
ncbi:hypothetical protein [Arthrobacter gallicola]|uniref:hypothetical protein n=1 Tax=Arthrobacter gallicola TaxID=2762225 RepID=UPI001786CF84|nr:hypothetical protein [Arthrobacter gallicola]